MTTPKTLKFKGADYQLVPKQAYVNQYIGTHLESAINQMVKAVELLSTTTRMYQARELLYNTIGSAQGTIEMALKDARYSLELFNEPEDNYDDEPAGNEPPVDPDAPDDPDDEGVDDRYYRD
jgi:hypothetical protein